MQLLVVVCEDFFRRLHQSTFVKCIAKRGSGSIGPNDQAGHGLQSNVIDPQLVGNLTYMIQGLIVLFVGADVIILYVWSKRRRRR